MNIQRPSTLLSTSPREGYPFGDSYERALKKGYDPSEELEKDLTKHLRKTIGPIATPEQMNFVSKLPKTRSGKIMRRVLKAIIVSDRPIGDITTLEDETSIQEVKQAYEEFKRETKK